ncbi:MAG: peptide deformylase [Patescibacteria group bacterium]|jgi:peptide deformylase
MKTLPIVTHPTPSLRVRSKEVDPAVIGTPDFQAYLEVLIETMWKEDGVGLASPQVGRNERIIVITKKGEAIVYINPEITKRSEATVTDEEGCLSVPGVWGLVERAKKVTVQALDRHGRRVTLDAKALEAVIFQHEIDHIDGTLFIDKVKEFTRGTHVS